MWNVKDDVVYSQDDSTDTPSSPIGDNLQIDCPTSSVNIRETNASTINRP